MVNALFSASLCIFSAVITVALEHSNTLLLRLRQRQRVESLAQYELKQLLLQSDGHDHLQHSLSLLAPATSSSGSLWTTTICVDESPIHSLASVKDAIQHIHSASSVHELIAGVRENQLLQWIDQPWTIEYECLEPPARSRTRFSSKNLLCALAQLIPVGPIIGTDVAPHFSLHVFDTAEHIHLGWKQSAAAGNDEYTNLAAIWAARSFVFSAALSIEIATMCVNILSSKVRMTRDLRPHQCTFFDPCCGSGTTLFAARCKGFGTIVGSDVNVDFVRGTKRNLEYVRGKLSSVDGHDHDHDHDRCSLFVKDAAYSALPWRPFTDSDLPPTPADTVTASTLPVTSPAAQADVIFCNLPWNENVGKYHGENEQILGALASEMRAGCECAFVTKEPLDGGLLEGLGLGVSQVVPIGGSVGVYPNKQSVRMDRGPGVRGTRESPDEGEGEGKDKKRTGDCYVTFCCKIAVPV